MWHEARKQEKVIRGMMVDYQRRAERRRDFYEKVVRKMPPSIDKLMVEQFDVHLAEKGSS